MRQIAVGYCFDRHYSLYTAVSTYSLLRSTKERPRVYWCIPEEDVSEIRNMLARSGLESLADIDIISLSVEEFRGWKVTHQATTASYMRLLLPERVSEPKLLYLDSDTLVTADVAELFAVDLGNHVLAGVPDPVGAMTSNIPRRVDGNYVNTGVLLLNLDVLRQEHFRESCTSIYHTSGQANTWLDQCLINKFAEGRTLALPEKWNLQVFSNSLTRSQSARLAETSRSAILHFVGSVKPWQNWCNPVVSRLWWSYAKDLQGLGITGVPVRTLQEAILYGLSRDPLELCQRATGLYFSHLHKKAAAQSTNYRAFEQAGS